MFGWYNWSVSQQITTKLKDFQRRKIGAILGLGFVIIVIVVLLERSVAAYCSAYRQEKTRLNAISNQSNPYPSGLFNVDVTDAGQIATSLGKLDRVAPTQIESEVSSLEKLYQDIHENPAHAISDSLNGGSLDDSLKAWTQRHCSDQRPLP